MAGFSIVHGNKFIKTDARGKRPKGSIPNMPAIGLLRLGVMVYLSSSLSAIVGMSFQGGSAKARCW